MSFLDNGGLRAANVWHRRAGKDFAAIHQIAKMSHQRRGLYWHMLPTQRQARRVVWDAITKAGDKLIDQAFPRLLRDGDPNHTDMRIRLKCGSIYQLVGSDNYDSLVGANPVGVVFSEWSLTDPRAWDYIRPILLENDGWAWFIYTPRGYNHGWDIKTIAETNEDWHYSLKTIDDTGVVTAEDIAKEARDGMPEELIQQEFYCSFSAANVGSVIGDRVEAAEKEGRIIEQDLYDPQGAGVIATSDIGFRDTTAWWFWQPRPDGVALIHYMEESGMEAQDWIGEFQKGLPFKLEKLYLPHDARVKTFATKNSALEQFLAAKLCPVGIVPMVKIADRINAARAIMPHCRFAKPYVSRGLASLREWCFKWDDRRRTFSRDPDHNWASHGGDSFSYGATVLFHHIRDWNTKLEALKVKASEPKKPMASGVNYAFSLEQLHENRHQMMRRFRI